MSAQGCSIVVLTGGREVVVAAGLPLGPPLPRVFERVTIPTFRPNSWMAFFYDVLRYGEHMRLAPEAIIVPYVVRDEYVRELMVERQAILTVALDGGWHGTSFMGLAIVPHTDVPPGEVWVAGHGWQDELTRLHRKRREREEREEVPF